MIYLLSTLSVLFIVGILLKKSFPRLCVICFAVNLTWIAGLVFILFRGNTELVNTTSLAILMGGSAVGGLYYFFRDESKERRVFKLPYLLTAFVIIYFMLTQSIELDSLIFLTILWAVFYLIYLLRQEQSSVWFKKIVECCKNW